MLDIQHLTKTYGEKKAVDDLTLQVRKIDFVRIDNTDRSDTGCGKIHRCRSTKSTGSDDQHFAIQQLFLAFHADFLQNDMA